MTNRQTNTKGHQQTDRRTGRKTNRHEATRTDGDRKEDGQKNKNKKNKNKFISEQKMKFDDNEILLINILLETHTMGTTAIT